MTPTGLICEEVLKSDWQEFDSFAKNYPKYEYLKSVEDYKETDITGILDAWSQGGGKEKRYPVIYCLLEFKGDNVFRVASRSTAQSYQKGFDHSAVALCEGKGIKFEKPRGKSGTSKGTQGKKKTRKAWTDEDKTNLEIQLEDSEVLCLRRRVEELAEQLDKVLGTPVMAK